MVPVFKLCAFVVVYGVFATTDATKVAIVTDGEVMNATKEEVRKRMAEDAAAEPDGAGFISMMYARAKPNKEDWGGGSFSLKEQKGIVDAHNEHRKDVRPKSSDMAEILWNSKMADQAQAWSDGCFYEHPNKAEHPEYAGIGQNLYIEWMDEGGENRPDVTQPVDLWYGEERDFDYQHNSCNRGAVCGHFTQVVWAKTAKVGCGITFCPRARSPQKTFENAWIITCNYSPAGNMAGAPPYTSGQQCASCEKGFCRDGLCSKCKPGEKGCECNLECQNCGDLDRAKCRCTCQDGFNGPSCEKRCEDQDSQCGGNPGWPASWCNDERYPFVAEKCPALCKQCKPGSGKRPRC